MTSDPVETYFRSIGIHRPKSQAVFEKHGRKRFGKAFEQLLFIVAQRESGVEIDPYEVKNSSLDLSLYVGEYHTSEMWREFASWLVRENPPSPSEVLDLGCENGVLTCCYAILWPDAKVVGVERSQAAVSGARELAKRLGLGNVSVEQADARRFLDANAGRFQIILATLVMHELLKGPATRMPFAWDGEYERVEDVILTDADLHAVETLKAVGEALADGGILISLDRSPHLASKWWYTQCLEGAGMKVSLTRSNLIECPVHPGFAVHDANNRLPNSRRIQLDVWRATWRYRSSRHPCPVPDFDPMHGIQLLTPLVNGVRVSGPFGPTWSNAVLLVDSAVQPMQAAIA